MAIEDDIASFKADVLHLTLDEVFDAYIDRDECAAPLDFDPQALRNRIAMRFRVPLASVKIVGSAKLGFTLRDKIDDDGNVRAAFSPFYEGSDIDVAIVDSALFDHIWKLCFAFWHSSGYAVPHRMWRHGEDFRHYIFRGWMRPDKLPTQAAVSYTKTWFEFFRRLVSERAAGDYPIKAGLYREDYFLRTYQTVALNKLKSRLGLDL